MADLEVASKDLKDESLEDSTGTPTIGESAEEAAANALRDNIARKGKNAYYYCHGHNASGCVHITNSISASFHQSHFFVNVEMCLKYVLLIQTEVGW